MKDHDLSYQKTTLNFDRLLKVANIATGYCKSACERSMSDLQNAGVYGNQSDLFRDMKTHAKALAKNADALAFATDTLFVLEASKEREELIIDRTS